MEDERDLAQQLKQETQASSGRKPREETRARRCGNCGETGHNARTCQIVIEMSEKEDSEGFLLILGVVVELSRCLSCERIGV